MSTCQCKHCRRFPVRTCRHCGAVRKYTRRSLCRRCYQKPAIRSRYAVLKPVGLAGFRDNNPDAGVREPPPTTARPAPLGTPEREQRVAELRRRFLQQQALFRADERPACLDDLAPIFQHRPHCG